MEFVTWTKQFETGISFIDSDHRILVNLINQANACINKREESSTLTSVLTTLFDYTEFHFAREEKLMEDSAYDGLEPHKLIHQSFAGQVQDICQNFNDNPESIGAIEVRDILKNWLVDHITGDDFGYRATCLNNISAQEQARAMGFMDAEKAQNGNAAVDFSRLSVMVVDDNKNFLVLLKTILRALGIRRVQIEKSAEEAIEKLRNHPVDLVFCDWIMDEMNGEEFAHKLNDLDTQTKMVLLTGYSIKTLQERSSSNTIAGYLEKPVNAKSLLGTISTVFAS
jgi:hemerythrin-like metal-binding protein